MPLRIAYFGLPLAACLLTRDSHEIALAVLAPVAAPGRRRLIHELGSRRVLDAHKLGRELERAVEEALHREGPDLVVSWFWTRRLPARWLELAPLGGVGVHPSLLPRHRGPDPYYWAIDSGDRDSGVTVHRLTARYDDGNVLAQRRLSVGDRNSWQLARALDRPSLAALRQCVRDFARGAIPQGAPQDETLATWAPVPSGEELRVDLRWPTQRVLRRIRALSPVPALKLDVEGLEVTVLDAVACDDAPRALDPGEACVAGEPPKLVFRTGDGGVRVERGSLELEQAEVVRSGAEIGAALRAHLAGRARER